MPHLPKLLVALAFISTAAAFPLSALTFTPPLQNIPLSATQLLSLHDGTYLTLIHSFVGITELALNPRVRTVPFLSQDPIGGTPNTNIVARIRPSNDSIIWAYAISEFRDVAYAVVDEALRIFVVGDAAFPSTRFSSGFRVLRFSVNGEASWAELYADGATGGTGLGFAPTANQGTPRFLDLAGSRTLAIASADITSDSPGRIAFFVDTVTRKLRQVRFPLPVKGSGTLYTAGVAADTASGAACFADVEVAPTISYRARLFVQCANVADESEVVSRVLVPFEDGIEYSSPRMIMVNGGEGNAAALYVVAVRALDWDQRLGSPYDPSASSDNTEYLNEMLVFKLNPATLEDVEWESGRTSKKPTVRKLLLTTAASFVLDRADSLEYIRDRNTLVVQFASSTILYGIETLPDGTVKFRGDSSTADERSWNRRWLLYFGNEPEPAAVRIPYDPRPNGEQDNYDFLNTVDLELSEDKRSLYLFGSLERVDGSRYGGLVTFSFPLPKLATPSAASLATGDDLGDGVDESFEPSPDETADASMGEELTASPNPLQDHDCDGWVG